MKGLLGAGMRALALDRAGLAALASKGPYLRILNYHGTPTESAAGLERQLAWLRRRFEPASREDLEGLLAGRPWMKPGPGLLVSFDDGLRSSAEVAAPILERHGFRGWFFVPSAFPPMPEAGQRDLALSRNLSFAMERPDGVIAMTPGQLRALSRAGHEIGSHTRTHLRLVPGMPAGILEEEVAGSRRDLEGLLGRPVDAFCWTGGEEASYSAEGAEAVRRAGYRLGFMTCSAPVRPGTDPLHLHRTNVEAHWPLSAVAVQVCGLMDRIYAAKRARVDRVTA